MKKYDYMQIGIASPEEIESWAHGDGEVKNGETPSRSHSNIMG